MTAGFEAKSDAPERMSDIEIIDCDAHFTEPPDVWTSRVPPSWKDRVPTQRTVDGMTNWYLDGEVWASTGGNTIGAGRKKMLGTHMMQPFESIDPAAYRVPERLELMRELGIHTQVLYPNGVGFASNHIFAIEDIEQRSVVLSTFNDFYCDLQSDSNERLLPQAMVPIWDMDLTVKEMTRLIERGIRGFTLSDRPELLGLPELNNPYFDPMWDLFNESGTAANFHISAGATREQMESVRRGLNEGPLQPGARPAVARPAWSSFGHMRSLAVSAPQGLMSNVRIISNLCMSDLFDRFPKLQIVSAESGIGWVPFILEALEYQLDEMVMGTDERHLTKRRPTEYFRDHIYVMFWFENSGPQKLLEDIGVNNVLVETDIPHPTCYYPGAREHFAKVLGDLPLDTAKRVLRDNAAELYRVTL